MIPFDPEMDPETDRETCAEVRAGPGGRLAALGLRNRCRLLGGLLGLLLPADLLLRNCPFFGLNLHRSLFSLSVWPSDGQTAFSVSTSSATTNRSGTRVFPASWSSEMPRTCVSATARRRQHAVLPQSNAWLRAGRREALPLGKDQAVGRSDTWRARTTNRSGAGPMK